MIAWALVVASYLLGSVPFSFLVVRLVTGGDLREVGSGNVGATNAMRAAGKGPAALVLALDIGKGVAPVVVGRALDVEPVMVVAAATAAVLGHVFPLYLGFRGGKGVATAAGALGSLAPIPALCAVVIFVVTVAWKRYVSLGSIVAVASYPPLVVAWELRSGAVLDPAFLLASAAIPLLVIARHHENVSRLRRGTERRLGARKGESDE